MKTPAGMCLLIFFFLLYSVLFIKHSKAESYEYLQFVLQYPRGVCVNDKECFPTAKLPVRFTLHGIWPTNISTTDIKCKKAVKTYPFDKNLITPLLQADLAQSWPTIKKTGSDMGFWQYEYDKHGSCTAPTITQKAYFESGHKFWKEYDLYSILAQKNIKPRQSQPYLLADLEAAVKSKIGTDIIPVILCKEDKLPVSSKRVLILREIVICFDHQGTNLVNCTRSTDCKFSKPSPGVPIDIYYV